MCLFPCALVLILCYPIDTATRKAVSYPKIFRIPCVGASDKRVCVLLGDGRLGFLEYSNQSRLPQWRTKQPILFRGMYLMGVLLGQRPTPARCSTKPPAKNGFCSIFGRGSCVTSTESWVQCGPRRSRHRSTNAEVKSSVLRASTTRIWLLGCDVDHCRNT